MLEYLKNYYKPENIQRRLVRGLVIRAGILVGILTVYGTVKFIEEFNNLDLK